MTAPTATDYRRFIRPSFLPVLAECPAAAQLTFYVVERFGEPDSGKAADIGSDIHACVMLALLPLVADPEAKPDDGALARFPGLSGWDQACVRRCVEFAVALIRKTRNDYPADPVAVLLEHHLDGSVLGIDRGGSADLVIVVPFKHLRVVDWKAGFLDQGEAADHDQLAAYGVMAAATFSTKSVEVYLFQPRAEKANRASGARFGAAELKATETWTRLVVEEATSENPEAKAGLHCTKCRALSRCPEAKEFVMRLKDAVEVIGDPTNAEGWAALLDAAKVAERFAETALDQAKAYATGGGAINRWKLQPTGSMRFIDSRLAVKLAQDAGVLHLLLEHVTVKATAADAVDAIAAAVTSKEKAPSLKPVKASAAA